MSDDTLQLFITVLGFAGGVVFGFAARSAHFCTLGAIEEAYYGAERTRLRTWMLAVGVAIAVTQYLDLAGYIDLARSWRLSGHLPLGGAIIGGLMFGFGMALVGTCAFGMLVRLGGGDMRALLSSLVLGIVGFMTMSGVLARLRLMTIERLSLDLPPLSSQMIPKLLFGDSRAGQLALAALLVAALVGWALSSARYRAKNRHVLAALALGLCIGWGWLVTSTLGQETLYPQQPDSYSFVRPIGQSILWLMIASGASASFAVGGVFGVIAGAFLAAWQQGEIVWEGFDDAHEMRRHLFGAALMGVGGILAGGCTIGQGMTGVAALSLTAFVAIAAIIAGALIGIRLLIEGEWPLLWQRLLAVLGLRRDI